MTIAGSDSGAGAGIQADLKTFAAMGVYGTSVLTAVTAQNTVAVTAVHDVPTDVIAAQIDAVVTDIGVDAVKTGMLSSSEIIECVAASLKRYPEVSGLRRLVVDPVMVAKSGDSLLRDDAVGALRDRLLPLAAVITPNIPEAETLTGRSIANDNNLRLPMVEKWYRHRFHWEDDSLHKNRCRLLHRVLYSLRARFELYWETCC